MGLIKCLECGKEILMRKTKRVLIAVGMVLVITISVVPLQNATGTQSTVQAATIKLNKSAISLDIGKTQKLKVSGTKAKVKWSSTDTSVVKVNNGGTVTAVSSGNATVKAKVGKKTLSCKVTVKNGFSVSEATKNISVTLQDTEKGVVAILKNNNDVMVDIDAKLVYLSDGRMIDTASDYTRALEKGKECALFFIAPMDGDYGYVSYDDYKINLSVSKASYEKSEISGVGVESNRGADNITAKISNNSDMNYEFVKVAVVFYDAGNNAIGYDYTYADCLKSGSIDYISFDYPYNSDYETIRPSSYKIYVNEAYTSIW